MALKSYGALEIQGKDIVITSALPHVSIKLKDLFRRIPRNSPLPYKLPVSDDVCRDMIWFMYRYPFTLTKATLDRLKLGSEQYMNDQREMENIFAKDYAPIEAKIKAGAPSPRNYQLIARDWARMVRNGLLADDIGLGKTLSAILTLMDGGALPATVVVETHMQIQWKKQIERFTNLRVYRVKSTRPYPLPTADVYIFKYSQLAGWADYFIQSPFKTSIYDEVQALRRCQSDRYGGGLALSRSCERNLGLSATPVFNYGDEIFNIVDLLKEGCLGDRDSFIREWCSSIGMNKWKVDDPDALGTYLRDQNVVLRRTRKEVGRELPPINTIVHDIDCDEQILVSSQQAAIELAYKMLNPSEAAMARGQAAMEFDMLLRHSTGVSKAIHVAAFVRMLIENGEKVILAGWHRDVYDIWMHELRDFNPIMYTGSESPTQKDAALNAFINGTANPFIMSLRSGSGIDGLQEVCSTVVIGELDYSPEQHKQLIGRVARDKQKGEPNNVTAFYMYTEYGSDPGIMDLLGLKAAQAHGIMNPGILPLAKTSDESRVKKMAENFLKNKK